MKSPDSLFEHALAIVRTPDTSEKVELAKTAARAWFNHRLSKGRQSSITPMPDRPGRPEKPELVPPRQMPKRRLGGPKGKIAMLHALAHIELNAVDMTWDLIGRYFHVAAPASFFDNWVRVGVEEAKHFELLDKRLQELGANYGDLPAHDGLWQAAQATGDNLLARIAIVPLVLEARGLDVSPSMIEKLRSLDDDASARILEIIYNDEKFHVAVGLKWFRYFCEQQGLVPEPTFQSLVRTHFRGHIKPPFNDKARSEAGLTPGFYKPLAAIGTA